MKLKDKKIEILRQITTRDEHGFGTTTLEPISAPVWAYFRQLSGKEVFAAATTNYKEEVLFTVNYNPEITNTHVIRYNGVLYDITRVETFDKRFCWWSKFLLHICYITIGIRIVRPCSSTLESPFMLFRSFKTCTLV